MASVTYLPTWLCANGGLALLVALLSLLAALVSVLAGVLTGAFVYHCGMQRQSPGGAVSALAAKLRPKPAAEKKTEEERKPLPRVGA